MDVSTDTKSVLVTGVADVRHTLLDQLARQDRPGLSRVLTGPVAKRITGSAFSSSI